MPVQLKAYKGFILVVDQLGVSSKTTNDLKALTDAMPKWLDVTKSIVSKKPSNVYFCWLSDTWLLHSENVDVLYKIIDGVFNEMFWAKRYLRGALVNGRFYDLSNLPLLKNIKGKRNVRLVPLLGAGLTRAVKIESSSVKGIRVVVDVSTTLRRPATAVQISKLEQAKLNRKLSSFYGWNVSQTPFPTLVDYPWWRDTYKAILIEIRDRIKKSNNPQEIKHLEALRAAIYRWIRNK